MRANINATLKEREIERVQQLLVISCNRGIAEHAIHKIDYENTTYEIVNGIYDVCSL